MRCGGHCRAARTSALCPARWLRHRYGDRRELQASDVEHRTVAVDDAAQAGMAFERDRLPRARERFEQREVALEALTQGRVVNRRIREARLQRPQIIDVDHVRRLET